jgi:hypothetical protein
VDNIEGKEFFFLGLKETNIYFDHEVSGSHRGDCSMGCDVVW